MCAFPNHTHSIEFATGYIHSKSSNTHKQYECSWAKFQLSKGMNTYAMESFKFFIFNKFAKMLKKLFFCFTIIVYGV